MPDFKVRLATMADLEEMMAVYRTARQKMKDTGNPTQWGDFKPTRETIYNDILASQSYVVADDDTIYGAFALVHGDDPTYQIIEDGAWLNDAPYAAIHRVASAGKAPGVVGTIVAYCQAREDNLRIDTHHNNKIMQHLMDKNGFTKCGIIYAEDGTPRIAYQKIVR